MHNERENYSYAHTQPYSNIARVYGIPLQVDIPGERVGKEYNAIRDTGASSTCISNRLVDYLSLPIDGYVDNHTANGTVRSTLHTVDVRFQSGLYFKGIQVVAADMVMQDVLIGTDIISLGDLSITNYYGRTIVTFGVPSIKRHDYVAEAKLKSIIAKGHMPSKKKKS